MPVLIELFAVELAVTVSVGAVLAFVSGLMSTPEQSGQRDRPQGCRQCGSVRAVKAGQAEHGAGMGHP